jgi:hypothetical protein
MKKLIEKFLQKIMSIIKRPKLNVQAQEEVSGLWMIE